MIAWATAASCLRVRSCAGIAVLAATMLVLASCSGLQPAAPYDPEIEKTVSAFDVAVQDFIADMQGKSRTEAGVYAANVAFYKEWKVTLGHLRNRAFATEVGTSCGPDKEFDGIVVGGFKALNDAMEAASQQAKAFNVERLHPIRDKAHAKLKEAEARLKPAQDYLEALQKRLNDLRAAFVQPGAPPGLLNRQEKAVMESLQSLREMVADAKETYDGLAKDVAHWQDVYNRFRGVIVRAAAGEGFMPAAGGCTTRMLTYLYEQLEALERFHMAQEDIGIPPRRAAPILMSVPVQVILKAQARKKYFNAEGVL